MEAIDKLIYETLGWTWVAEYAAILLIAAAALLLILLITFIIVAARHGKNKKKFKKMQAQIDAAQQSQPDVDNGEYRAAVRAEIEPIVRAEIEREYAQKTPVTDEQANARINELNAELTEKNKRIKELGDALMQANNAHKTDNTELYRTINDLNQEKRALQNDVNILRAENSQLKTQQRADSDSAKRVASTRAVQPEYAEQPPAAKKPTVKKAAPVKQPDPPEYDDDDDEDEYYDDYGDENSAVKVTLKFDRLKANWVIYRSDTARAFRRFPTKQEAIIVAKDLAKRLHAQLVVHKKDGKFQKI